MRVAAGSKGAIARSFRARVALAGIRPFQQKQETRPQVPDKAIATGFAGGFD